MSILENIQGKCTLNKIGVKFELSHNVVLGTGLDNKPIIKVQQWNHKDAEADGEKTTAAENVNYIEKHPQICIVTIENDNYPYKIGDKLFVHYMAYETCDLGDMVTGDGVINADLVLFKYGENDWEPAKDVYIGIPIINDEVITKTGIIAELGKKDALKVKITHVPAPYVNQYGITVNPVVNVDDTVLSIDKYNYEFSIDGKFIQKYVKLNAREIAAVLEEVA